MKWRLNNSGDTIVEVLVAIVVVGSVLAGAYITSNKSLNANRASQERGEALKYTEAQLEQVRADPAKALAQPAGFCYKADGTIQPLPVGTPNTNLSADDFSKYTNCNPGAIPGGYNLSITQASNVYTVRARWLRSGGGGNDAGKEELIIYYRVTQ